MERTATAVWQGGLKSGEGKIASQSGVLSDTPYSFARRFGYDPGTNPEELIAAAHAACFSMALSSQIEKLDAKPEKIETHATVYLDKIGEAFEITRIHLSVSVQAPGITDKLFQSAATNAKMNCPISKLLRTAEITMEARLEEAVAS